VSFLKIANRTSRRTYEVNVRAEQEAVSMVSEALNTVCMAGFHGDVTVSMKVSDGVVQFVDTGIKQSKMISRESKE